MGGSFDHLVMLDIGGIHDFIFGTNKLREIRGASTLLDILNRKTAVDELKKKSYGTQNQDWKCVLARGGNVKALFKDKGNAQQYQKYLKGLFGKHATGAKATVVLSSKNGQPEKQWIHSAERELQRAKDWHQDAKQIIGGGFFKACGACGLYPAEHEDQHAGETRFICTICHQKIEAGKEYTDTEIYRRLKEKIKANLQFASDFGEIGAKSEPRGYIGFIYADANRMGEYLPKISTFDELTNFSKAVENANFEATITAITNHFTAPDLPLQVILAGGDDLILAVPAHNAIDVAIDFCEEFSNRLKAHEITTSASIVICHDSLPVKNILRAAEALLKNAKAEGRKKDGGSHIDFTVVSGSALEVPVQKRKSELEYNKMGIHSITQRPYPLDDMKKLIRTIKDFKKADFPHNKLEALYDALFTGHYQSILDACYIKMRLKESHKDEINKLGLTRFPWKKISANHYVTPLGDIVELYEFIQ